jgi:hypothetical protein
MAKTVTRKNQILFGQTGGSSNFGQFGSAAALAPLTTKDLDVIQALDAWLKGFQDAVAANQAPYLQDMNGLLYVYGWQIFYMLQEGIPEWNADTTYYIGGIVRKTGTNQIYSSLIDDNVGDALPSAPASNASWKFVCGTVGSIFAVGDPLGNAYGIQGVATNSNAAAGIVGEYVRNYAAAVTAAATNTFKNITSISLTAGDWDVTGLAYMTNSGTRNGLAVSQYPNNTTTDHVEGDNLLYAGGGDAGLTVAAYRLSLAGSATVYLKGLMTYSTGGTSMSGRISARRVR